MQNPYLATGLDDRFRLTAEEAALGLAPDFYRKAWDGPPPGTLLEEWDGPLAEGIGQRYGQRSRKATDWLHRLETRRAVMATRLAKVKAGAEAGNPGAMTLQALIETWPATVAPRADYPDTPSLNAVPCPIKTPEAYTTEYGEAPPEDMKFPHRAWVCRKYPPVGVLVLSVEAGLCPVCGWEARA